MWRAYYVPRCCLSTNHDTSRTNLTLCSLFFLAKLFLVQLISLPSLLFSYWLLVIYLSSLVDQLCGAVCFLSCVQNHRFCVVTWKADGSSNEQKSARGLNCSQGDEEVCSRWVFPSYVVAFCCTAWAVNAISAERWKKAKWLTLRLVNFKCGHCEEGWELVIDWMERDKKYHWSCWRWCLGSPDTLKPVWFLSNSWSRLFERKLQKGCARNI